MREAVAYFVENTMLKSVDDRAKFLGIAKEEPGLVKVLLDKVSSWIGLYNSNFKNKYIDKKLLNELHDALLKAYEGNKDSMLAQRTEVESQIQKSRELGKLDKEFDIKEKISNFSPEIVAEKLNDIFYEDNPVADRVAVVKYLQQTESGKDVIDKLYRHKGTNWAKTTAAATAVRMAIEDLLQGKEPTVNSLLSRFDNDGYDQRRKLRNLIKKNGIDGIFEYYRQRKFMSGSKKPLNSVNGSYLSCNPSDACAEFCYAAGGNQSKSSPIIKSELVYAAVKAEPIRVAKRLLQEYKFTAAHENGKALRFFDMGDLDEVWLPVIKYMNDNKVVTQIFTKNPELLNFVDRNKNVVNLSIDATNAYLLDQYPDMPVALVYTGETDLPLVEKCQKQMQQFGGVILPVKKGKDFMPQSEIDKLPKWTKPYQCPVDNGSAKLSDGYNCTNCDSMNGSGVGCFKNRTSKTLKELYYEIQQQVQRRGINGVDNYDIDVSGRQYDESGSSGDRASAVARELVQDDAIRDGVLQLIREVNGKPGLEADDVPTGAMEGVVRGIIRRLESKGYRFVGGGPEGVNQSGTASTGRTEATDSRGLRYGRTSGLDDTQKSRQLDEESVSRESEPQPVGRGVFGDIYDQFKGKAKEAIKFLLGKKSGETVDVLRHKDVDGGISLVWGDEKAGLAHIIGKHPELVENPQEVLDGMSVSSQSDNRIVLESDTHKAVISKMKGSEPTANWLLTAYEKKKPVSASSSDIETEPEGKRNGTAAPQNELLTTKVAKANETNKVSGRKVVEAGEVVQTAAELAVGEARLRAVGGNKVVSKEYDAKYAKAVESKDIESAQQMVDDAAREAGYTIKAYHGTRSFGWTVPNFERSKGNAVFLTDDKGIAASYGVDQYARTRNISNVYIPDDGTQETLIKNAKNVLGQEYKPLTKDIQEQVINKYDKDAKVFNNEINHIWNNNLENDIESLNEKYPLTIETEYGEYGLPDIVAYVLTLPSDVIEYTNDIEFSSRESSRKYLKNLCEHFNECYRPFKNWLNEHKDELKSEEAKRLIKLMDGFKYSDFEIDVEFTFLNALNPNSLYIEGHVVDANQVRKSIEDMKDYGSYTLAVNLGNNPLVIDCKGAHWTYIEVKEIGDKHYDTDYIAKWARENGYTSVVYKNVLDPANKLGINRTSNEYAIFSPEQIKSADPVTYDDKDNVVSLSDRFNEMQPDIRYSRQLDEESGAREESNATETERPKFTNIQDAAEWYKRQAEAKTQRSLNLEDTPVRPEQTRDVLKKDRQDKTKESERLTTGSFLSCAVLYLQPEICRDGGFKFHFFAGVWVNEAQAVSMQAQAVDGVEAVAIFSVASHWMPQVCHVNPNLVLATGLQAQFHKRALRAFV